MCHQRRILSSVIVTSLLIALALLAAHPAGAVPSFARQTGAPCSSCHVGSFGPHLTEYGRNFKIGGYREGDAPDFQPFSAMAVASYLHTAEDLPDGAGAGFNDNNNVKLEEASLFYAGRIIGDLAVFAQVTYDGIGHHIALDNTDIRYTREFNIGDHSIVGGLSLNNNPTIQDPWNSTPAWGFPFTTAALLPTPIASVQIDDALGTQVFGLTAYAMIDDLLYVEAGGYRSLSNNWLKSLGEDVGDRIDGFAPYWRLALQKTIDENYFSVGTFGLHAPLQPGFDSSNGNNTFTDIGLDATFQRSFGDDVLSASTAYIHESQQLDASFLAGESSLRKSTLSTFKINAAYTFDATYGVTVQWFDTWGSSDPLRFAANPIDGSASNSPNSRGFTLQADWTPFGGTGTPTSTYENLRLGVQYTNYSRFNGGSSNYDGAGRDASDNNAIQVFAWVAF